MTGDQGTASTGTSGANGRSERRRTELEYGDLVAAYEDIGAERPWLLEGAIERTSLMVLAGPEKRNKSWILTDAAVALATGGKWLGTFQAKAVGRVDMWDGEYADHESARRIARAARGRGHDPREVFGRIRYLYSRGIYLEKSDKNLNRYLKDVRADPPVAIIIDPWRNHLAGDENSAQDTLAAMHCAAALADASGAAVLIAHHLNRAGTISGSRALLTRADVVISGTDDETPWYSAIGRTIRRNDPISTPFRVLIEHIDDHDDRVAKTILRHQARGERVPKSQVSKPALRCLDVLRQATAALSANQVGKAADITNGSVRSRALEELRAAGLATIKGGLWSISTQEFFDGLRPKDDAP